MFALRRAALRITTRPLRSLPPAPLQFVTPVSRYSHESVTLPRSFHQSRRQFADDEQKKPAELAEAGQAEAESTSEPVTVEPSAVEQKAEVTEESIATSEVSDASPEESSAAARSNESTATAAGLASHAATAVQDVASSAARTVRDAVSVFQNGQEVPPSKILYVGNLFFEVTNAQLENEFLQYGKITDSRVIKDTQGMSKGFGYVEFDSISNAERAMTELNQKVFHGRRMLVQYHVPREERFSMRRSRPTPTPISPTDTLFIGNMSYQMSDRDLNDLFRDIRDVIDVRVAIDRRSGQPRGFAHADFVSVNAAMRAKEILEKKSVYGRQLRIDYSVSHPSAKQR